MDQAELKRLFPFESKFLELGGTRLHYVDEGAGDPVVMLHGNPTWSFMYRELILRLRGSHRAVALDHVGMGLSDKPDGSRYPYTLESRVRDLEAFLDRLGLGSNLTLVVHDWGGMIGLAYAVRHPERVRRIVAMNTAAFLLPQGKPLPWTLKLVRDTPLGAALVRGLNGFAVGASWTCCPRRGMTKSVRAAYVGPYDSWDNRIATLRFVQDIPLSPDHPSYALARATQDGLARLSGIPTLLVWGGKDFVFDLDFLAEWKRRLPSAECFEIPDAGHYVLEDAPELVLPRVEEFLSRFPLEVRA